MSPRSDLSARCPVQRKALDGFRAPTGVTLRGAGLTLAASMGAQGATVATLPYHR